MGLRQGSMEATNRRPLANSFGIIDIRGYVKEDGQREGGIEVGQREEGASRFMLVGRGIYWLIDIKIVGNRTKYKLIRYLLVIC